MYFIKYALQMQNNPRKAGSDPPHRQFMVLLQLQLAVTEMAALWSSRSQPSVAREAQPCLGDLPRVACPTGTSHIINTCLKSDVRAIPCVTLQPQTWGFPTSLQLQHLLLSGGTTGRKRRNENREWPRRAGIMQGFQNLPICCKFFIKDEQEKA